MLKKIFFLVCLFGISAQSLAQYKFIENKNQWDSRALFRAEIPNGYLFLEERGFSYLFYDPSSFPQHAHDPKSEENPSHKNEDSETGIRGHVVKITLKNAQEPQEMEKEETFAGHYNFLLGNNSEKWGRKAKAHGKITYKEVYPAIDLSFLQQEQDLKYEFRVRPNGNPQQILLIYEGQDEIYLHEEHLYVKTSVNAMKEERPYCYQVIDGQEQEVESEFRLEGNQVSFHFPAGYNTDYELVIDPKLVFSTFSGSFQDNWGFTATPDSLGHLYAGGMTRLTGAFPTTPGVIQDVSPSSGTETDIAITKYSPDGTSMVYSTYLGGLRTDIPHSLIVNHNNQLVILGSTSSSDFPMNADSYDTTFASGNPVGVISGIAYNQGSDLFVSVLSEDGSTLIGSSYWGGTGNDGIMRQTILTRNYGDEFRGDISIDAENNIYVCSVTESADFPTRNTFQTTLGGVRDAVVAKFNANATNMDWSTYLGGAGEEAAYGLKLTSTNDVVIVGGTSSTDYPTTAGVLHETFQGAPVDGFVSVISNDGTTLQSSSYIGTTAYDQVFLVDLDASGNIAILGQTLGDYPVSDNVYSNTFGGQFIHKLSSDLKNTVFSTVIGGLDNTEVTIDIRPTAFLVSDCNNIYLTGWGGPLNYAGGSTDSLPITPNAIQPNTDGSDFYMMVLSAEADRLVYGTYLGNTLPFTVGDHVDGGTARFDKSGVVYQSVCSCGGSSGFPTTPGVVSNVNNSTNCNNVAIKFDLTNVLAKITPTEEINGIFVPRDSGCEPLALVFLNDSIQGEVFEWNFGDGNSLTKTENTLTSHTYQQAGIYVVTLTSSDSTTCEKVAIAVDTITVFSGDFTLTADSIVCAGDSILLEATGGVSYDWSPSLYLDSTDIATPLAIPDSTIAYSVIMENSFGCVDTQQVVLTVPLFLSIIDTTFISPCDTFPTLQVELVNPSNAIVYEWFLDGNPITPTDFIFEIEFDSDGNKQLILQTERLGCIQSDTINIDIARNDDAISLDRVTLTALPSSLCLGDTAELSITGGTSYIWQPSSSLSNPSSATTLAFPTTSTTYQIRVFNIAGDCSVDTNLRLDVSPSPQVIFSSDWVDAACGDIPSLKFTNNSVGATNFLWQFSNGDEFTTRDLPIYRPQNPGALEVILTALQSCQVSDTARIEVLQIGIPPNAFSPNGDGVNDTFEVLNVADDGWQIKIFNRWGDLVFETNNYQNDWDGGNNTDGSFFYFLTSPTGNTCRGIVHVFR